jgi:acetyl/propionyl-CoA carboxylase alpha subunit
MIAKLIAHAPNRAAAAARLAAACRGAEIWPLKTNSAFLANALDHAGFIAGDVDTGFIQTHLDRLIGGAAPSPDVLQAAAMARLSGHIPTSLIGFRVNAPPRVEVRLQHGADTHTVNLHPPLRPQSLSVVRCDDETVVFEAGRAFAFTEITADASGYGADASDGAVRSPMPGHVLSVMVAKGDAVTKGTALLVMEAMKMEMTLTAPIAGAVKDIAVKTGEQVAEGVILLHLGENG